MRSIKSIVSRTAALAAVFVSVFSLAFAPSASAIINGTYDANRHPNTGALVYKGTILFCSGVLISPQYFATAGHCIDAVLADGGNAADVTLTFSPKLATATKFYQATEMKLDPKYYESGRGVPQSYNDWGVVKLQTAVSGITPANLPAIGVVDTLPRNKPIFETVGYGATGWVNNEPVYPDIRNYGVLSLSSGNAVVNPTYMKLGDAQTGACYGDSGGPTYRGADIRTVYALTSYGAGRHCQDWLYAQRLDTQAAYNFYKAYD